MLDINQKQKLHGISKRFVIDHLATTKEEDRRVVITHLLTIIISCSLETTLVTKKPILAV